MKRKLKDIKKTINKEIEKRKTDAGFNGSYDNGAGELESNLYFFCRGINSAKAETLNKNDNYEFIVPSGWEKYFIKEDPEYKEYLRLHKKYKNI